MLLPRRGRATPEHAWLGVGAQRSVRNAIRSEVVADHEVASAVGPPSIGAEATSDERDGSFVGIHADSPAVRLRPALITSIIVSLV
jgi:hypothetical protein